MKKKVNFNNILKTEIIIRFIKIIDITYITCLYFFFGYFIALYSDRFFEQIFDRDNDDKSEQHKIDVEKDNIRGTDKFLSDLCWDLN